MMVDAVAIAATQNGSATRKPSLGEALVRARYKYIPDHVLGEILTKRWIDNVAPFTFLIITVALFGYLIPDFFSPASLVVSLRQLGEFGFVVLAMMIVMVAGGIDLSVGSNFALGNFTALAVMNILGWPVGVAFLCTLVVCCLVGLLNGALVGLLRLRAFLTTLVTLIIVRAIVDMLLLKYAVQISGGFADSEIWDFIGSGSVFGLPFSFILLIAAVLIGHVLLSRTRPGWRIMAVGGSRRSAHNSGISVRWTVCGTYVLSGALVGDAGFGMELAALAAALLGGNSLGGGRGSTGKALTGAIIVLVITNGVVRLGIPSGAGGMLLGLILLLAAALDVRWLKNRHKVLSKVYVSPTVNDLPPCPATAAG